MINIILTIFVLLYCVDCSIRKAKETWDKCDIKRRNIDSNVIPDYKIDILSLDFTQRMARNERFHANILTRLTRAARELRNPKILIELYQQNSRVFTFEKNLCSYIEGNAPCPISLGQEKRVLIDESLPRMTRAMIQHPFKMIVHIKEAGNEIDCIELYDILITE